MALTPPKKPNALPAPLAPGAPITAPGDEEDEDKGNFWDDLLGEQPVKKP